MWVGDCGGAGDTVAVWAVSDVAASLRATVAAVRFVASHRQLQWPEEL